MKLNLIERQVGQPGGSRGPAPNRPGEAGEFGRGLSALGQQIGAISTELAEREAHAKRAGIISERVASARVEYSDWFTERTKDPAQHDTLVADAVKFQRDQRARLVEGLDTQTQGAVSSHLNYYHASQSIRARATASKQGADVAVGRLDKSLSDLSLSASQVKTPQELNDIVTFGRQSIEEQRRAGTITAEQAGQRQRAFGDQLYTNQIERDLNEAPEEVLELLEDSQNYSDLRPDLRTRYVERAKAIIKGNKAEGLKALREEIKEADFALDRGFVPPGLAALADKVKGTELERDFAYSMRDAGQVAAFALQPPRVQEEILAQGKSKRTRTGRDVMLLERLEKTQERQAKQFKDDPMQLGVELGVQKQLEPLALNNYDAMVAGLKERATSAARLEGYFGKAVSPLFARDIDDITTRLREGDVSQRLSLLGALNDGLGERSVAAVERIAKKGSRQLAYAGAMLRQDPEGARLLVTGIKQREADKAIVPKDADLLSSSAYTDLMEATRKTPKERADITEAVQNIYATLAAESGVFDGGLKSGLLEKAIEHATGGVIEFDPGIRTKGSMILAPRRGVSEKDFTKWVNGLTVNDLARMGGVKGIDEAEAVQLIKDKGQLHSSGPGRYIVQLGGAYLMRSDGEPFELTWPSDR